MLLYMNKARVAELVDALDLGSSAARCKSSSLFSRTTNQVVSSDANNQNLYLSYNYHRFLVSVLAECKQEIKKMPCLTDQFLSRVKQPQKAQDRFIIRDSLLAGFAVVVSSKSISYTFTKQINQKRKHIVIGKFPFESCEQARIKAFDLLQGKPVNQRAKMTT